jgi:hypothetical protein
MRVSQAGDVAVGRTAQRAKNRAPSLGGKNMARVLFASSVGGRLGTKQDAQDQLTLLQEASAEMKKLGQDGKCWDAAEKEFKLPNYATWPAYEQGLPFIARRYCALWGRGT